jgi:hypothetical protein
VWRRRRWYGSRCQSLSHSILDISYSPSTRSGSTVVTWEHERRRKQLSRSSTSRVASFLQLSHFNRPNFEHYKSQKLLLWWRRDSLLLFVVFLLSPGTPEHEREVWITSPGNVIARPSVSHCRCRLLLFRAAARTNNCRERQTFWANFCGRWAKAFLSQAMYGGYFWVLRVNVHCVLLTTARNTIRVKYNLKDGDTEVKQCWARIVLGWVPARMNNMPWPCAFTVKGVSLGRRQRKS